jgi:hypothetical protein
MNSHKQNNFAGGSPAAGYFLLLRQNKVTLTGQFIANRDIGGRTANPEDAVHDCIITMYQTVERAWLDVGADERSKGK